MESKQKINPVLVLGLALFAVLVAFSRFLPHPPNFTPVLALFVFFGALRGYAWTAILGLAAILLSDLFLGFYDGIEYVYMSYLAIFLIGKVFDFKSGGFQITRALQNTIFGGVLGSVLFFLISNLGVWKTTAMYPQTWDGFVSCYIMALPFFHYTVLSTVGALALFHLGFALLSKVSRVAVPRSKF